MVLPFDTITERAGDTQALGETLGRSVLTEAGSMPRVLCLWGELGSGKTTFVQGLAKGLGITARLLSPTFIIVRRYRRTDTAGFLYHLDLYRMTSADDTESIGFGDMIRDESSLTVIEWPERLGVSLPKDRLDIRFSVLPDGGHHIVATYGHTA